MCKNKMQNCVITGKTVKQNRVIVQHRVHVLVFYPVDKSLYISQFQKISVLPH